MRYRWTQDYKSGFWVAAAGDVIECDGEFVALINRDSPGSLVAVAETRAMDAPPVDRMVRTASMRKKKVIHE